MDSSQDVTTIVSRSEGSPGSEPSLSNIGRYVVLGEVGAGGMGRVYRAYDPKLRREVALKVLARDAEGGEAAARIVREAQAMAQLSHPNIVPVYDVEHSGETTFIVMEYVDGVTLRAWMAAHARPWREVLAVFLGAGRGLAAAHSAGLVHRDFKPANVMVGADGRARVMDFGLVRTNGNRGPRGFTRDSATSSELLVTDGHASELTVVGTVMGTPPYMAPEQHRGDEVGAAADQYAFCVALFEALFGHRPFVASDLVALMRAKLVTVPEAPPSSARSVPRWLHAAVVRGLAPAIESRWPRLDALLHVLEHGQARARTRRVVIAAAGVVFLAGGAVASTEFEERRRRIACDTAGDQELTRWDASVREQIRIAFREVQAIHTDATADRVIDLLDQHADAWSRARGQACVDGEVREAWSPDVYERALSCLDDRRVEFESLIDELLHADVQTVFRASNAALRLSSVRSCVDEESLKRQPATPADHRESVEEIESVLARARALRLAGNHKAAAPSSTRLWHGPANTSGRRSLPGRAWHGESTTSTQECSQRPNESLSWRTSSRDKQMRGKSRPLRASH